MYKKLHKDGEWKITQSVLVNTGFFGVTIVEMLQGIESVLELQTINLGIDLNSPIKFTEETGLIDLLEFKEYLEGVQNYFQEQEIYAEVQQE